MKSLTLWQPWASLIALGAKTIETRAWPTKHRGPLAIHAAVRMPNVRQLEGVAGMIDRFTVDRDDIGADWYLVDRHERVQYRIYLPLGAVVATCNLVDCIPMADADEMDVDYLALGEQLTIWREHPFNDYGEVGGIVEDQRPYGDFSPGRWAWLLEDVTPLALPVPATGHQGLWNWEQPL